MMNTLEHLSIGNAVTIKKRDNPYIDEDGTATYLNLMCLNNQIPRRLDLRLTLGELVAMPDYFTDPHWNMKLNLEPCQGYESVETFGRELIEREISKQDRQALLGALADLANPDRHRHAVDTVFCIAKAHYFPVDSINELIRQLMFFIRVNHYDKKLDRNQTHFTPWSIRVYVIGHTMALDYAEAAYQLKQRAQYPAFRGHNPFFKRTIHYLADHDKLDAENLEEFAHRFHIMALEIELYTAHYLSDHFAAGHLSQVGDLRVELPERYGVLGGLAVNCMHNELNRIGLKTRKPYDPTPDATEPPLDAYGDNDFDRCENYFNREECIQSLQTSIDDIEAVLDGAPRPDPTLYGALNFLPDVDENVRQPEPMFLMHDEKILVRGNLRKIRRLGPDDYDDLQKNPIDWGYKPLSGRRQLLTLLFKLRLLPFYRTNMVPLTSSALKRIEQQEKARQADRQPMPTPPCNTLSGEVKHVEAFFDKRRHHADNIRDTLTSDLSSDCEEIEFSSTGFNV